MSRRLMTLTCHQFQAMWNGPAQSAGVVSCGMPVMIQDAMLASWSGRVCSACDFHPLASLPSLSGGLFGTMRLLADLDGYR
jgi:hypothetical protein